MKKMEETRHRFEHQILSKPDFIDGMYNDFHSQLFSYASWLQGTNISRIEISDGKVLMVSRDHGVKIICPELDKRVAPIEILNFGNYELTDSAMIMKLVKSNACVLDIGANMGWYALNIAKQNPNATVYAFEPIGSTYLALQENVRINDAEQYQNLQLWFFFRRENPRFLFLPWGFWKCFLC